MGSIGTKDTTDHACSASHVARAFALPAKHICSSTTSTILAPINFTVATSTSLQASATSKHRKPEPILIPRPTLAARDINRIPTPLSGRGDLKGHLFPYSRSPSPRDVAGRSAAKSQHSSVSDSEEFFGRLEWLRSASPGSSLNMRNEALATASYPTSPLSPKPPSNQGLSPQNSQRRGNHGRPSGQRTQLNVGRFHPSNYIQAESLLTGSSMQAPQITYTRAPAPVQIESPRLLREKHREFLEKAKLSSKLAASPLSIKPDAPKLNPLGSPKGVMTPLELEGDDYFSVTAAGKRSPVGSPKLPPPHT